MKNSHSIFSVRTTKKAEQHGYDLSKFPLGPSPWALINRVVVVENEVYRFTEVKDKGEKPSGLTCLENKRGQQLLFIGFYVYMQLDEDGNALLWRELGDFISFDCFSLSRLSPIEDPQKIANDMREKKTGTSPISGAQHWIINRQLPVDIVHKIDSPTNWAQFGETLVLADCAESNGFDISSRAIFDFNWVERQVQIYPQDWFNNGAYDFGYQWVWRVARNSEGTIFGDCMRLPPFELDDTNRKIKRWLR